MFVSSPVKTTVEIQRIKCAKCTADCLAGEDVCWRCGAPLKREEEHGLIDFSSGARHPDVAQSPPRTVLKTTLTGEVVEVPDFSTPPVPAGGTTESVSPATATPESGKPVFRMTYCKTCGVQNDEGAEKCRKCGQILPLLSEPPPDLVPLRRSWGFDLLGVAWLVLGFSAVYCGRFLIKADPAHPGVTWSDYFWTGVVVCAPGVMIFLRHYFCRMLFWLMTFGSLMVWSVIGFIWLYVGLHVTENGRVGLLWLGALSGLSVLSYLVVRLNDEFDAGS